jgi:hypothetical protein
MFLQLPGNNCCHKQITLYKMMRPGLYLLCLLLLSATGSFAQPVERLHIHFDKDIYLPGETIWFKAYLYNGGALSSLSTNFYAAIYDEEGRLLEQKTYPVSGGTCNGDFLIADTITARQIRFRGFTRSILAADSVNQWEKILTVYRKGQADPANTGGMAANTVYLQFFPEGGNWIAGINNYLAFKAWYANGTPAEISGVLEDDRTGSVTDSFHTTAMGMGKLQVTPGHTSYTARWKTTGGLSQKTPLPEVQPYGIALHAELNQTGLYYHITKNTGADNFKTLHLMARMDNEELYRASLSVGDRMDWVGSIPRDSLPAGIVQLTLFGEKWNPLQERVILVPPRKENIPAINGEGRTTASRAKNTIEVLMPDTVFANMSASIADINFYDRDKSQPAIRENLWFAEQVKALPETVLRELQRGRNEELADLILMTHGWRRYSLPVKKTGEEILAADNYLSLKVGYKEGEHGFNKKESLKMIIKDKVAGNQFFILDPIGQTRFEKNGLIFYDSAKVYFRLSKDERLADLLEVKRNEGVQVPASLPPLVQTTVQQWERPVSQRYYIDSFYNRHRKFNDVQTIGEVVVKGKYMNPITKRTLELENKYTSGTFSGIARGYQLNVLDDPYTEVMPDLFSYLRNRFPGLGYAGAYGSRMLYPCPMIGKYTCDPVMVFLNESVIPGEMVETIQLSSVAYVKYIPGIVAGSSFATGNGVIYIYTKKGDEPSTAPGSMRSAMVRGYDLPKEFFNPDYSDKRTAAQPDTRTTLYWNPYLVADRENRKLKIEYYNNDISGRLLLTIEGIDALGRLIHIERIIE